MGFLSNLFKKKTTTGRTLVPDYVALSKTFAVSIERFAELKPLCVGIAKHHERYKTIEHATGCPWRLIAALHYREASNSFAGVLHNGEKILGTGKKTKLVPAGRGPFQTWEEAAIDAIMLKKSIFPTEWTIENMLAFAEKFNGLGYRKYGIYSAYVWAGTQHYVSGMYVKDGVFDHAKKDPRFGVAAILAGLV